MLYIINRVTTASVYKKFLGEIKRLKDGDRKRTRQKMKKEGTCQGRVGDMLKTWWRYAGDVMETCRTIFSPNTGYRVWIKLSTVSVTTILMSFSCLKMIQKRRPISIVNRRLVNWKRLKLDRQGKTIQLCISQFDLW